MLTASLKDQSKTKPNTIEIVTDPQQFRNLKPEWDELWKRSGRAGIFLTADCCRLMWETIAEPERRKLFCLVSRDQNRLIAIWPLIIERRQGLKCLTQLGSTGAEYVDVLHDETVDVESWIVNAFKLATARSRCDYTLLAYVRIGTAVDRALSGVLKSATIEHDMGAYAPLRDEKEWDAYYSSLSKSHRKKHGNLRRRLDQLGTIRFEVIQAGDPACTGLVDWMLAQKKIWCERTNRKGHWIYSDRYRQFLTRLLNEPGAGSQGVILLLTLNGDPIAVKIATVSDRLLELLIAGFDHRYEKYSPGMRLDEHWVRWALERKLDCDFGNGPEHYKKFWSRDNTIATARYLIPNSLLGQAYLQLRSRVKDLKQVKSKLRLPKISPHPIGELKVWPAEE